MSGQPIQVEVPGDCVETCPPYQYVMTFEGRELPITNMFDVYGDDTNAPMRAHKVLLFGGSRQWITTVVECPEEIRVRPD